MEYYSIMKDPDVEKLLSQEITRAVSEIYLQRNFNSRKSERKEIGDLLRLCRKYVVDVKANHQIMLLQQVLYGKKLVEEAQIYWYKILEGKGLKEVGFNKDWKVLVKVDPKYFRPTEVFELRGRFKARKF